MSPQPGYLGPPQQVPPRPRPRPGQGGGMSVSDAVSKYGGTPQMGGPGGGMNTPFPQPGSGTPYQGGPAGGGGGVPGGGQGMPPAPGGNRPPGGAPPNPNPGPYPPGGGRPPAPGQGPWGQGPRTPQGQRPGGLAGSVNPNNTGDAWQQWKAKNSMLQPVQQPGVRPDGSYPGPIVDGKQTYIKDGKVVGYEDMPSQSMPGYDAGGASPGGMQFMPYGGMEYSQAGPQGY